MKRLSSLLFLLAAAPALAHPGHVAASAGHSHWLAIGAIALAVVIAIGGAARALVRRRRRLARG